MDDLESLAIALAERADAIHRIWPDATSLSVSRKPKYMLQRRLWMEEAAGDVMEDRPLVAQDELPEHSIALSIGYHRVLIGSLGTDPDPHEIEMALRRHLNQAAIDWSWLGNAGDDLLLILVGSPGNDTIADWQYAMETIERDERVCRKLVWLPPVYPDARDAALDTFLDRTFLALPWLPKPTDDDTENSGESEGGERKGATLTTSGDLDRMTRLFAHIAAGEDFSEVEAKRWIAILSDPAESADLPERLVAALEAAP